MLRVAVIVRCRRLGERAKPVAEWAYDFAQRRDDAESDLLDVAEFNLPLTESTAAVTRSGGA
jgi:hypothetical protein